MELILWRHAEAEPGEPDASRILTAKGRKQARKMAEWLNLQLPENCKVVSSPATRCVQTVEALGRKFKTLPGLDTHTTPEKFLAAVGWPAGRETVLAVGHQPTLGQVAALLMSGMTQDWTVRKGGIWWIGQRDDEEAHDLYLKAVVNPGML